MSGAATSAGAAPAGAGSWIDRALRPFADVRPGEGANALLMMANLFLLMVGYSVLKVAREPLILLEGGAPGAALATAAQAVTLMAFIPAYGWFSRRVKRLPLVLGTVAFFLACVEAFFAAVLLRTPHVGFAFFVWIGIFNNAMVAQFWSYANDVYDRPDGERLFPLIVIGAVAGAPLGSRIAAELFRARFEPPTIFQLSAALLLVHLVLYVVIHRRLAVRRGPAPEPPPLAGPNGFSLVLRSPYLRLIAFVLIVLNVVNTTGEQLVRHRLAEAARGMADPSSFVGAFVGEYQFWVNVAAFVLQALVASRLVRWFGLPGVLLALPFVSLGVYGLIALGVPFAVMRWAKTAENATDYSIMNTARAMMWLPTSRAEKYKGKQTVDTFFVRVGDLIAAGFYLAATRWLGLGIPAMAIGNVVLVAVWLYAARGVLRENAKLAASPGRTEGAATS